MKNVKLLILLGVLLLATVAVCLKNGKSTIGRNEGCFSVEDTAAISTVTISNAHGGSVCLQRYGRQWLVDGQTPARPNLTAALLKVLHDINKSKAVAKNAASSIETAMKTDGYHITVNGRRKALASYSLLFSENNVCHALIDGAKRPFEVEVPGYPQLITILRLASASEWKSRTVFAISHDRISQIVFDNPAKPDRSFTMRRNGNQFELFSYPLGLKMSNIDNEKVAIFMQQFARKDYSAPAQLQQSQIDSITATQPLYTLSVTSTDGREQWCRAYKRLSASGQPDPDIFYLLLGSGDFVEARYYDFDPVVKSLDYFTK